MSDLDTIAINDMKHEQCDVRPCRRCSQFRFTVKNNGTSLGTYYGDSIDGSGAADFALNLAANLTNAEITIKIGVNR